MAYCNVSQFIAKKQIKINNICNFEQVEKTFKSSAYLAWNNVDILSNHVYRKIVPLLRLLTIKLKILLNADSNQIGLLARLRLMVIRSLLKILRTPP